MHCPGPAAVEKMQAKIIIIKKKNTIIIIIIYMVIFIHDVSTRITMLVLFLGFSVINLSSVID